MANASALLEDAPAIAGAHYQEKGGNPAPTSEENDLWSRYIESRDHGLREELILRYLPLVKYIIGRLPAHGPSILDLDDLKSYGTLGLMKAIDRYDPSRGVDFKIFAIKHIRGSIIDALRSLSILSRVATRKIKRQEEAIALLQQEYQRSVSDDEVANYLDITYREFSRTTLYSCYSFVALDSPGRISDGDEPMRLSDMIADQDTPDPLDVVQDEETRRDLLSAIHELSPRDRWLLRLHYHDELSLLEISEALGISESRVSQLHGKAIRKLRQSLRRADTSIGNGWQPLFEKVAA